MAITVDIRGGSSPVSVTPMVRQGVPLLPVRTVVEALGGQVRWDESTQSVIISLSNDLLQVQIDQQRAISNSVPIALLSAPEIKDGTTYMAWYDLASYLPVDVRIAMSPLRQTLPQPLIGSSVCIDPGHGGSDPGAQGSTGLLEKDVNLPVCLNLAVLLRQAGARVVMTRDRDQTKSLSERSQLANDERVNWFISVHCNSFAHPSANGTETYHHPGDEVGARLAAKVHAQLLGALGRYNRGVKTADFHVLRATTMPAILTELAFISNPDEERLLVDPQIQARLAQAIYQGVLETVAQG